jgi:asparagine synthase (glutamine-hydrolysing)
MPRERAEAELRQMLGVIRHAPSYVMRAWMDEELGVYIGWSAREGSFSDGGPYQNETGDVVLVFSGEEYPAPDTIHHLKQRGHRICEAPASYLVHLSEEDASFPAGLNGLFHGVLADRRRGRVSLFNDRYGMHRLYYYESDDAVYFAGEAKAILAVRPELRTIDGRGLGELITLGCVLENRTVFDGLRVVPGGSLWTFENGARPRKGAYFQPKEWEDQERVDDETFYAQMRDVFSRNLPRYFAGRERVAMSLTGGLDTRMIMAWQQCPPGSLPCYTWGGTYRDCQDVIVAREVARACRQPEEVITMGTAFLSRFSDYADRAVFLTDGCVDVSAAADVYMNERAAEIAPVRMTGLYGGEVLRHVRSFKPVRFLPGLFQPTLRPRFDEARNTYEGVAQGHQLSFGVFRQAPWHHYGNLSLERTQVSMRSPFLDNEFVKTVFRAPESAFASNEMSLRLIADGGSTLSRIPTDRGVGGNGVLPERVLHPLQEFTFKAEYAYDYGMPQWLARLDHFLAPLRLERLFLGRHKALHYRIWYRGELSAYVRDTLLDPRSLSRPYLERATVEQIVGGHVKGDRNYTSEIHKLLTLELLHRHFVDAPIAGTPFTGNVSLS